MQLTNSYIYQQISDNISVSRYSLSRPPANWPPFLWYWARTPSPCQIIWQLIQCCWSMFLSCSSFLNFFCVSSEIYLIKFSRQARFWDFRLTKLTLCQMPQWLVTGFLRVAPVAALTQSCFNNFAISFCCRNLSTQHPLTGKINQMISCKSKEQLFQKK